MNQTALFQAADNFKVPASNRFHPLCKQAGAVAVTERAGPDNTRALHRITLHCAMKTSQDLKRLGHGLRIEIAVAEYTFTQACNLAILMQRNQPSTPKFGDAEPHRVGTDIDGGKDGHALSGAARSSLQRLRRTWRLPGWLLAQRK